jgi:hypothetical protein
MHPQYKRPLQSRDKKVRLWLYVKTTAKGKHGNRPQVALPPNSNAGLFSPAIIDMIKV